MMTLLVLRARLRDFYQKYELYINPIIKFIVAMIVFQAINNAIGYDGRIKQLPVQMALSLLSAFMPSAILVLLAALVSIAHIYSISQILSVMIIVIFGVMYCLFLRFSPKLGVVVIGIPILYVLKIPYVIPILLGVFATPISIVPVSCGVIIYFLFKVIQEATAIQINVSLEDTLSLYVYVVDNMMGNKALFMTILIFSLIIIVTYFVRRMSFDYSHEIAIMAGGLVGIIGFLLADLKMGLSKEIGSMIVGTLISMLITLIIQFFYLAMDYSRVERVQFEDEDYYYYVKAVPKINVTAPQVNVKRFYTQKNTGLTDRIHRETLPVDDFDDEDYEGNDDYEDRNKNDVK
ncbi:MAG: hypothetical protein ACK5JH_05600 [Anaerocolumna sp.]